MWSIWTTSKVITLTNEKIKQLFLFSSPLQMWRVKCYHIKHLITLSSFYCTSFLSRPHFWKFIWLAFKRQSSKKVHFRIIPTVNLRKSILVVKWFSFQNIQQIAKLLLSDNSKEVLINANPKLVSTCPLKENYIIFVVYFLNILASQCSF